MRFPAKLLLWLFSLSIFLSLPLQTFAQTLSPSPVASSQPTTATDTSFTTPNVETNVPRNQHVWVQTVMIDVLSAMACQLSGIDPVNPNQPCLGANPVTGKLGYGTYNGGLLGMLINGVGYTYTPPAHSIDYIAYLSNNFGVAKPVLADTCDPAKQGAGFCGLFPLLPLWTFVRNMAYLGFVVVFILVGFAIMLRIKINPNTVVSIQSAIPRIIIALILITFSYAIAGFLIDVMYVVIGVSVQFAVTVDPANSAVSCPTLSPSTISSPSLPAGNIPLSCVINQVQGDNPISFMMQMVGFRDAANTTSQALGNVAGDIIGTMGTGGQILVALVNALLATSIVGLLGPLATTPIGLGVIGVGAVGGITAGVIFSSQEAALIGQAIAFVIIILAVFVTMLRVWVILIRAYVSLLIDIVFGPMWILFSVAPRSKFSFMSWIRSMMANLSVFPVVIGLFLLAKVFIDLFNSGQDLQHQGAQLFAPPLIGVNSLDLSRNNDSDTGHNPLAGIIALGFIMLAPTALSLTRSLFKSPQTSFMPTTLQGVGVGARLAGSLYRQSIGRFMGEKGPGKYILGTLQYNAARKHAANLALSGKGTFSQRFANALASPRNPGLLRAIGNAMPASNLFDNRILKPVTSSFNERIRDASVRTAAARAGYPDTREGVLKYLIHQRIKSQYGLTTDDQLRTYLRNNTSIEQQIEKAIAETV